MADVRLASDEQACRHQQRQRQRHLSDDNRTPQPVAPWTLRTLFIFQGARQVVARRLKRGQQIYPWPSSFNSRPITPAIRSQFSVSSVSCLRPLFVIE